MTDDDVDLEMSDTTLDMEIKNNGMNMEPAEDNNFNNNDITQTTDNFKNQSLGVSSNDGSDQATLSHIPDLLKTITKSKICDSICYDLNCSDIENNFNTNDIIGDFNKEIEEEIKQVLNYNINIQDDLEELRKDIQYNFATPIEKTISNISEVVNHVIKKLVETHSDVNESENSEEDRPIYFDDRETTEKNRIGTNPFKDMHQPRPTFLLLEKNINNKITDAFLSDGKEEIFFDEALYSDDPTNNVDNTIKLLSTELRKIIPKLDELREREKLFAINKREPRPGLTDGNCNEIARTSNCSYNTCTKSQKYRKDLVSQDAKENLESCSGKKFGFRSRM